jgi:hypothetical protein
LHSFQILPVKKKQFNTSAVNGAWLLQKFKFLFRNEEIKEYKPKNEFFQIAYNIPKETPIAFSSDKNVFHSLFMEAKFLIIFIDLSKLDIDFLLLMREYLGNFSFTDASVHFLVIDDEDFEMTPEEKILKKFKTVQFGNFKPIVITVNKQLDEFEKIEILIKSILE